MFCSVFCDFGDRKRGSNIRFYHFGLGLVSTRHGKTGGSGRVNRVAGQTGCGLSRVVSRVELTHIFQIFFFFFEVDAICHLFMSFLTVIRFSLVILLLITTKPLT